MSTNSDMALSYLGFQRFEPSARLSAFIDSYWFINTCSAINTKEYLHPDGGTGIILNYGDSLTFDSISNSDACILDGTNTFSRELGLNGSLNAVGIRFKPAGAYLFFSQPLSELKNETITLADIKLKNYSQLYDKLSYEKSIIDKVLFIERWLLSSLQSEKTISHIVKESLALMQTHKGILSINSLAKKFDCSQRTIERLFNSQVGITPKEYARSLRIEHARYSIKHKNNKSLTEISYDLGFYDQAHFINQFKKVVGLTPNDYYKKKTAKKSS